MDVKKYLKNVLELEKEIYTLNKIIEELTYQSTSLGIQHNYKKPEPVYVEDEAIGVTFFMGVAGMVAGAVITFIIGTIGNTMFNADFTFSSIGKGALWTGAIVAILTFIFEMWVSKDEDINYQRKMLEYERAIELDNQRIKKELKNEQILLHQIQKLKSKKREAEDMLQKLYGLNVLYSKYRYFVAVATIYEYFESGRCYTLEGHEGAYNIFESEIRLNVIINKLSDILYNLENIKANQMMVYNSIKESDRIAMELCNTSAYLIKQNQEIMNNTALIAYDSKVTAINTEILKYITMYS